MSFALQQKWGKWSARPVAKLAASKEIRQTVWANREVLSEAAAGQLPAALSWDPRERRGFPCSGYKRMSLSTEFIPQTKTMSHPSPWFPSSTDSVDFILLFLFFSPSTKFPPFFFFLEVFVMTHFRFCTSDIWYITLWVWICKWMVQVYNFLDRIVEVN